MRTREEAAKEIEARIRAKSGLPGGVPLTVAELKRIVFEVLDEAAGRYGPIEVARDPEDGSRVTVTVSCYPAPSSS